MSNSGSENKFICSSRLFLACICFLGESWIIWSFTDWNLELFIIPSTLTKAPVTATEKNRLKAWCCNYKLCCSFGDEQWCVCTFWESGQKVLNRFHRTITHVPTCVLESSSFSKMLAGFHLATQPSNPDKQFEEDGRLLSHVSHSGLLSASWQLPWPVLLSFFHPFWREVQFSVMSLFALLDDCIDWEIIVYLSPDWYHNSKIPMMLWKLFVGFVDVLCDVCVLLTGLHKCQKESYGWTSLEVNQRDFKWWRTCVFNMTLNLTGSFTAASPVIRGCVHLCKNITSVVYLLPSLQYFFFKVSGTGQRSKWWETFWHDSSCTRVVFFYIK